MNARFFSPDALPPPEQAGCRLVLAEPVAHHAVRVLRLQVGEPLVLFDGTGGEWLAELVDAGRPASVRLLAYTVPQRESALACVLVQSLAVADKMDWVVQKAVELGVSAIVPLAAGRSVLRLSGERAAKRVAHWQQVAVAACEQCGRNRVPALAPVVDLASWLARPGGPARWMLAPGGEPALAGAPPLGPVEILVGPEGGWSDQELALAAQHGVRRVGLGPRVLRTETAGLAMLAAMQARWGDFA